MAGRRRDGSVGLIEEQTTPFVRSHISRRLRRPNYCVGAPPMYPLARRARAGHLAALTCDPPENDAPSPSDQPATSSAITLHTLPVPSPLAELLPHRGLNRGATVQVSGVHRFRRASSPRSQTPEDGQHWWIVPLQASWLPWKWARS